MRSWAELNWPHAGRLVPVRNYHLTLAFLDQISPAQRDSLEQQLQHVMPEVFDLHFDEVGYWSDSQVLWIAPSNPPDELMSLARRCARIANNAGIRVNKKRYRPHLTLARRVLNPPPPAMQDRQFVTRVDGFALCESIRDSKAVRYRELSGWYSNTG